MMTLRSLSSLPGLTLALVFTIVGSPASADDSLRRCRALVDASARLTCYDALPLPAAAKSAAAPVTAARLALAPPMDATFGMPRADESVKEIVSTIPGLFEGWRPGDKIRLANGQLWQVTDDSSAVYNLRDPKVTVRRAVMSTFVLDIEGARRVPRVRRLE